VNEQANFLFSENKSCFLLIDYYENQNPIGKIYYPYLETCHDFFGVIQLLKLIEEIVVIPNNNTENPKRHFVEELIQLPSWDKNTYYFDSSLKEISGHLATFNINILFTQRNSWQGVIKWIEEGKVLCFRSVYELIQMLDNVLSTKKKLRQQSKCNQIF